MRTDPVFPSVCQSPSGVWAAGSSASREIFRSFAVSGAFAATGGRSTGADSGGIAGAVTDDVAVVVWDGATFDGGGAVTCGVVAATDPTVTDDGGAQLAAG